MKLNRVKEDVKTERWSGDIIEFVGGGYEIAEYLDERSVWKYARLAKALGKEAMDEYRSVDAQGNTRFNPMHYLGQEVSILVEETFRNGEARTRIKKVDPLERPNDWDKEDVEADAGRPGDPSPPDDDPNHGDGPDRKADRLTKSVPDDDIPF